jgi:dsRNA-specific ribonuclease
MRELSTKTLADVVEAIIGAAYVTGGIDRALAVINAFLPEHHWQDLRLGRQVLWEVAPANSTLPKALAPVEELIGYTFRRKSLLIDALTHLSYNAPGTTGCLERLEFIGDAILDNLVVNKLFDIEPALSHVDMHLLRTALVNGDFLAFLVMEWAIKRQEMQISETLATPVTLEGDSPKVTAEALETTEILMPLWSFMRHSTPVIALTQLATSERHAELRKPIIDAFEHSQNYPWALLARLQAQKFYSDLFESVLGAVWIDSDGSDKVCDRFLERSGVLPYMRRILRDKVHIWHPKEELGRLADREKVRYEDGTRKHMGQAGTEKQEKKYLCRVFVGDRLVAQVEGGVGKEEARTKAAEDAVRILKERRHDDGLRGAA